MIFLYISLLKSLCALAALDSPVVQGLAGAGRSGIPREALFLNPAATGLATASSSFAYYTKPSIPDWNAGGRAYSIGAVDGENPTVKGAAGFSRVSRARIANGVQSFEDRSEMRIAAGRVLWGNTLGGLAGRYITRRTAGAEKKFFQGDAGIIWPLFKDLRLGVTYENFSEIAGEVPPTLGAGLNYATGIGLQLYADGTRALRGPYKNQNSFSGGVELPLAGDFVMRGGKFRDRVRNVRGMALGLSWTGPRLSFDYSWRKSEGSPQEKDHIFGLSLLL
jgi:hypothetical protein